MKSRKLYSSLLLGAALLMAANAFAAEKETVETHQAMTVNGNPLPAGKYTVTWEGSGPSVELAFHKAKTVVATVPAHVVNLKAAGAAALVINRDKGSVELTQIRPEGKKYVLTIGGESVQTAAQNIPK
jgi:hypothetical protein